MNKVQKKLSGAALAMAAAGFVGSAMVAPSIASAEEAQVECWGINGCAGQNDCKTAENDCKGMAECKGQGFVLLTAEACEEKGGEVK